MSKILNALLAALSLSVCTAGQASSLAADGNRQPEGRAEFVKPPAQLTADGVPPVPVSLKAEVEHHSGAFWLPPVVGWHPTRDELLVKYLGVPAQVYSYPRPGAEWVKLTEIPASVYDVYPTPDGKHYVYNVDNNGDGQYQLYLFDVATNRSILLTDGNSRNVEPVFSRSGKLIAYGSAPPGFEGMTLRVMDPFNPKQNRLVATTPYMLEAEDWSPDERYLAYIEYLAYRGNSSLWLVDMTTGEKTLLTPRREGEKFDSTEAQFSRDGRGLYYTTNREGEFLRLMYYDFAARKHRAVTRPHKWDVESFRLSPDGKTLALVINEAGISRLSLVNAEGGELRRRVDIAPGIISNLKWNNSSSSLAFNFEAPREPASIYSVEAETGKLTRWAEGKSDKLKAEDLPRAELIRWTGFDGREITGFMFRPPGGKFAGPRPVIIEIHGGPEEQYRPTFHSEDNYFISALGAVKIYPNVRGSYGFGKTFLDLDNGTRRGDSLRDFGALLDWIKTQPDLDASRIMVQGFSYGGYMALLVAANYGARIRAAVSDAGPSNLVTFLESTAGWRRNVRRAEYGDERDPKVRAYLEQTAPRNNTDTLIAPLLVVQGQNDPRVRAAESEALIRTVRRNGTRVWYLLAKDEGHGFTGENSSYQFLTTVLFFKEHVLKP